MAEIAVGLIDVDKHSQSRNTFPNLSLMKLSAWHKQRGDFVEWYDPELEYDLVYISKVFSDEYSKPYDLPVNARQVIKGGSGFAFSIDETGHEVYNPALDKPLAPEIDHIMPDYNLYGIDDTAYGFLTKGCPRRCPFCHVEKMQGAAVYDFAELSEFWNGQKEIKLLDPNLTASRNWKKHVDQLISSRAHVDFTQGLDVRLMTKEKIADLNQVRWKRIHFAWDKPDEDLRTKFELIRSELKRCRKDTVSAYILTNYNSTFEQDMMRVMFLRSLRIQPYVMIYRKETAPKELRRFQRWVNSPFIFWKCETFEDYK